MGAESIPVVLPPVRDPELRFRKYLNLLLNSDPLPESCSWHRFCSTARP